MRFRTAVPVFLIAAFVLVGIFTPFFALIAGSFMRLFGFFSIPQPWTADHWRSVFADPQFVRASLNSVVLGMFAWGMLSFYPVLLAPWITAWWRGRSNQR